MVFYEDFLKKIKEANFNINRIEIFYPEIKKLVIGFGVGLPLILMGIFQAYMSKVDGSYIHIIFGLIFIFMGLRQLKTTLSYKIKIDTENKKINFMKVEIDLSEIESCTLKEGRVGKRLETILDLITKDKKQFIIPLYMNKKVRFVYVLKQLLGEKFIIKK